MLNYDIDLTVAVQGYDRETYWAQARAGIIPPSTAVITMQKAAQHGSDNSVFVSRIRWSQPTP